MAVLTCFIVNSPIQTHQVGTPELTHSPATLPPVCLFPWRRLKAAGLVTRYGAANGHQRCSELPSCFGRMGGGGSLRFHSQIPPVNTHHASACSWKERVFPSPTGRGRGVAMEGLEERRCVMAADAADVCRGGRDLRRREALM